jgi:hypothetical protein
MAETTRRLGRAIELARRRQAGGSQKQTMRLWKLYSVVNHRKCLKTLDVVTSSGSEKSSV